MNGRKIGVVFPGFDSQFVGMAKDVYDDSRLVQEYFEEAYNCLGTNFVKLCFASSDEELAQIGNGNIALFLANISLYSLLMELQIQPDLIVGYGIGHYAALFVANGFSLPDALYLINKYSNFYQEFINQHEFRILEVDGLALKKLEQTCAAISDDLAVTISHSAKKQLVAGRAKDVKKLEAQLDKLHIISAVHYTEKSLGIGINAPFCQSLADNFRIYLEKVDFKDLQLPVLSGISAKIIKTGKMVKKELVEQIVKPFLWHKIVQKLSDCDILIEVGPGNYLAQELSVIYPDKLILNVGKKEDQNHLKMLFDKTDDQEVKHESNQE